MLGEKIVMTNKKYKICNKCDYFCDCKGYSLTKKDIERVEEQLKSEWEDVRLVIFFFLSLGFFMFMLIFGFF